MAPRTRLTATTKGKNKVRAPTSTPPSTATAGERSRTKGRITRGRIIPAKVITKRTFVWDGLKANIASAASKAAATSKTASKAATTPSQTTASSATSTDEDSDEITIYLETEDIPAVAYSVSRTEGIDFARIKVSSFGWTQLTAEGLYEQDRLLWLLHVSGAAGGGMADDRLHFRDNTVRASSKRTAADIGLQNGDTIEVLFWL